MGHLEGQRLPVGHRVRRSRVEANVKAVQRMLGHARASMTLDVYADLFDEDLDGVADRLDRRTGGPGDK